MAKFEFDSSGFDEFMNQLKNPSFDVDCPECDRSFAISLDDIGKSVKCPHCGVKIEIQSED